MDFAENLKNLLDMRDIQVKELSAETGISKNTLDNYLSGQKSIPNAENAIKIARCLGVSAEYLVTGKPASIALLHNDIKGIEKFENGSYKQAKPAPLISANLDSFKSYGKGKNRIFVA